ncbi:STN domain-containing protein, partial [Pseudomonas protegens]|uniref:STN domain-containing protein n=1 Tax=Pseudomonas protegens TaxID=380021 RepID=UPI001B32737A
AVFIAGHNDLAAGKQSPGLNGRYSVTEALQLLLANSGLQAQAVSGGYVLKALPSTSGPLQLGTTQISAQGAAPHSSAVHRGRV